MSPLRTDGHLHDLAIEDVLDGGDSPEAAAHLRTCALCRQRLAAADAVQLPPLQLSQQRTIPTTAITQGPDTGRARPANQPLGRWLTLATAAIAAAALLLVAPRVRQPDPDRDDGFNVRGSKVSLRVYRDEGASSRRLRSGDTIATGDRLGFRVQHRAGHLMVLGIDARSEPYLCYPQQGGGVSVEVPPSPAPRTLPEAIRMDHTAGPERLVALLCSDPFTLDEAAEALQHGEPPRGCSASEITVVKP